MDRLLGSIATAGGAEGFAAGFFAGVWLGAEAAGDGVASSSGCVG